MPPDPPGQGEPGQQQNEPPATPPAGEPAALGESGLRALEKEREARRDAERKLKEAQEAAEREKLSEKQRLEKERDDANSKAAKAELETMRIRIGLKAGVPPEHISRVQGTTEEEIKEDAEAYAKSLGQQAGGLGGGPRGGEPQPKGMNEIIRAAAGRGQPQ